MTSDTKHRPSPGSREYGIHHKVSLGLQVVMLIGLAFSIYEQHWLNTLAIVGILLLIAMPTMILRRMEVFIPPELELVAIAFIFAALFLGETRGFYGRFWWWDLALHTTSGALLGILGFLLVYILNETPKLDIHMRPGFVAFFAFCFSLMVGTLWEIFEFSMDKLAGMNMQKPFLGDESGLTDTMWDLIVDAIGALVVTVSAYLYMKRGMSFFIERLIQRFIAGNPKLFKAR